MKGFGFIQYKSQHEQVFQWNFDKYFRFRFRLPAFFPL